MLKIGDFNRMYVAKKNEHGFFLRDDEKSEKLILLPFDSAQGNELKEGEEVDVFIYRDSSDRLIATMKKPFARAYELAYLKVVSNTKIGAFIDFGLERDILVPMKEQAYKLENDKYYLFYIYIDKTNRIAATTYIDRYLDGDLDSDHSFKTGDDVEGVVYGFQTNGSVMVAVDKKYKGVILKNEYFDNIKIGDILKLRVIKIYEDGKIGLTPRNHPKDERISLEETILEYLKSHDGFMPYNDKSSPEDIKKVFHESKNYFKNALGGLMKKGIIEQDGTGTHIHNSYKSKNR